MLYAVMVQGVCGDALSARAEPTQTRVLKWAGVLGLHAALIAALWLFSPSVQKAVSAPTPVMLMMLDSAQRQATTQVAEARPSTNHSATPRPLVPPMATADPAPLIAATAPSHDSTAALDLPPAAGTSMAPATVTALATPSMQPQPASPKTVAAASLRYRQWPAVAVPAASRRLGEAGTVMLRVVVDVQGLPRVVEVQRSSGFARLDEQAQRAMRGARFEPCTDDGRAIECEAIAPIVYSLDG